MSERRQGVVYLHGFNSSPASHKARQFVDYCQARGLRDISVPALPPDPAAVVAHVERCIEARGAESIALLVGSSLGGFYATWLAQRHGIKAALINPAVAPGVRLETEFLGPQRNMYTGEEYVFTREHAAFLRALAIRNISRPADFLVLLQTGDEVLDYRDALELYADCQLVVQQGGSHAFDNFSAMLPRILRFAGYAAAGDA